ncbi:MAG: hypothetical protein BYD32DRAFT_407798 [Podila humilis]|nr:MAG: hypothetical protein BYD32DRAFT_407798 [Podila humilis]
MPPQNRLSLGDIEEIETKRAATLIELHSAIVQEVREAKNWDNAWTLFSDYLCPAIVLGQERQQQQSENDIRMIQFSISAMVRYAPSTAESNAVYVFFLQQCRPPIRDDQTINNCLVSLIYQYAQAKDPEIQRSGLDLIKIALDRGVGLPVYSAHSNAHDHTKHHRFSAENTRKEHILVSVSKPILMLHQLRISADGTTLEPIVTGGGGPGRERGRPSDGGAHRRSNTNNSTSSSSSPRKSNKGDSPLSPKASNKNDNKAEGKHKEPKEEGGEPKEAKDTKEPKEKKRDAKASNNKDKDNKDSTQQQQQQQSAPRKSRQPKLRQEGESASTDASSPTTATGASSTPSSPSSPKTRAHNGRNSKAENNAHSSSDKSPQQKTQENNKKSSRPNSPPKASEKKDKEDKKEKESRSGSRSGGGGGRAAFAGAERNTNNYRSSRDTPSSSGRSTPRQILFVPASTNHLLKSDIDSTATSSSSSTSAAADAAVAAAGSASTSLSSTTTPKRSQSIRRAGAKKARESVDAKEGKDKEPSTTGSLAKDMEKLKLDSAPVQA